MHRLPAGRGLAAFVEEFNSRHGPDSERPEAVLDEWVEHTPPPKVTFAEEPFCIWRNEAAVKSGWAICVARGDGWSRTRKAISALVFLVVGAGIDPATSRFSGARSTN